MTFSIQQITECCVRNDDVLYTTDRRMLLAFFLDCLTLEDVTDRFSRNVAGYKSALRDIGQRANISFTPRQRRREITLLCGKNLLFKLQIGSVKRRGRAAGFLTLVQCGRACNRRSLATMRRILLKSADTGFTSFW